MAASYNLGMTEIPQRSWADKVFEIFNVIIALGIAELFVEALSVPLAQWGRQEYAISFAFVAICLSFLLKARSFLRRRRAADSPVASAS